MRQLNATPAACGREFRMPTKNENTIFCVRSVSTISPRFPNWVCCCVCKRYLPFCRFAFRVHMVTFDTRARVRGNFHLKHLCTRRIRMGNLLYRIMGSEEREEIFVELNLIVCIVVPLLLWCIRKPSMEWIHCVVWARRDCESCECAAEVLWECHALKCKYMVYDTLPPPPAAAASFPRIRIVVHALRCSFNAREVEPYRTCRMLAINYLIRVRQGCRELPHAMKGKSIIFSPSDGSSDGQFLSVPNWTACECMDVKWRYFIFWPDNYTWNREKEELQFVLPASTGNVL